MYGGVGVEANGSTLTILSTLAGLGKDPWAEAEMWAALAKAVVIDSLAESIAVMPLGPSALPGARDNAARLVQLLPRNASGPRRGGGARSAVAMPKVAPVTILYFAFDIWMALTMVMVSNPSSGVRAAVEGSTSTSTPGASHPPSKTLARGAVAAGPSVTPVRR